MDELEAFEHLWIYSLPLECLKIFTKSPFFPFLCILLYVTFKIVNKAVNLIWNLQYSQCYDLFFNFKHILRRRVQKMFMFSPLLRFTMNGHIWFLLCIVINSNIRDLHFNCFTFCCGTLIPYISYCSLRFKSKTWCFWKNILTEGEH